MDLDASRECQPHSVQISFLLSTHFSSTPSCSTSKTLLPLLLRTSNQVYCRLKPLNPNHILSYLLNVLSSAKYRTLSQHYYHFNLQTQPISISKPNPFQSPNPTHFNLQTQPISISKPNPFRISKLNPFQIFKLTPISAFNSWTISHFPLNYHSLFSTIAYKPLPTPLSFRIFTMEHTANLQLIPSTQPCSHLGSLTPLEDRTPYHKRWKTG